LASVGTEDIGKRVRLRYTDGSLRAEGRMIVHSLVPAVAIERDDGTIEWWRHDMADVTDDQ
jgi:hypothetical protein